MTNQTSFQDRLKKIEKKQSEAPAHSPQLDVKPDPRPDFGGPAAESPIGSKMLMGVGAAVLVLAAGGMFLRDGMSHNDAASMVLADGESRQVSLLGRLLGGSFDPDSVKAKKPIYHLPEAPDGWVRATLTDVRKMSAIEQIKKQWPEGAPITLEQNPGFKSLSKFVRMSQVKTAKTKAAELVEAKAHYLAADGSYLEVMLKFLPNENALGPENASTLWAEQMLAKREGFEKGQAPVITSFAGRPAVGQGNVALDPSDPNPTGIAIAVPLTKNSYIRVVGRAAPAAVATLVEDVNVRGLLAFAG